MLGQPKTFVQAGLWLYEINGCSNSEATEVSEFSRSKMPPPGAATPPVKDLIGISADLRIYQIAGESGGFDVVIERTGQAMQQIALPVDILGDYASRGIYLAKSQIVIWTVLDLKNSRHIVHSLDLISGKFRKVLFPLNE
jgi:hypothetical protein